MVSDKVKDLIGTIMFWMGVITLFLWALGKSFGIIHSPDWVEMIPYFSIAVAISSASTRVGRTLERIENIDKRVNSLDSKMSSLEHRINNLCVAVIKIGKDVKEIQRKAFCLNDARCPIKG